VFATAALFACSQLDPREACKMFVLGLVIGWLRAQSGSIVSSVLAYAAFYAVPLALGRQIYEHTPYPLSWSAAGTGIAIVALVCGSLLSERDARAVAARAQDEA
jgi:hypothetical protein